MNTPSPLDKFIRFFLENKACTLFILVFLLLLGVRYSPFDWATGLLPRDPVAVDAIPDLGENQQIIFSTWPGRSPQDIEDQITYPLTVNMMGIPGVKTIRSYSMLGFSTIYLIFEEEVDFYWSRSRILEKLNSLPANTLPANVSPSLGPDATGLGQVFWYTLEGQDPDGNPTGGWDLHELRSVQDWYVRYALQSVEGVSEVASVGGFVQEYQVDVDPDVLKAYGVTLNDVYRAIQHSNRDVGAKTIEVNQVEYLVRGLGFIKSIEDLEQSVVKTTDNTPLTIKDVANVSLGPALRRGALDKEGAEAVGGVVVSRFGKNPLETIKNIKEKIEEIKGGLPSKTLADGTVSQLALVPFYDRTDLIYETLGTLNRALIEEILIVILVVLVMINHFRSSLLIAGMLPLTVLLTFIAMKYFRVEANIVALSGIAIAIGTVVDIGIVILENILQHLNKADETENRLKTIFRATKEVGSAVLTTVLTTVISFLPILTMEAAEGKLFKPLAWTKTFALVSALVAALAFLPALAHLILSRNKKKRSFNKYVNILLIFISLFILSDHWLPLGLQKGSLLNFLFVGGSIALILISIHLFQKCYPKLLTLCLNYKKTFLSLPLILCALATSIWLGFDRVFFFLPESLKMSALQKTFPGLGKEFMPPLDEGSFLYMPTTMPHASMGESLDVLSTLDQALKSVPEVAQVVGKIGRAESALDPAPLSMVETVINYKPEYILDKGGNRLRFKYEDGEFVRDDYGELIEDENGQPFRQWRDHIQSPRDIWDELIAAANLPGTTSAPYLQPIAARIVMLQSGLRAPMGVKVRGPDLKSLEKAALEIEKHLKRAPHIESQAVFADRVVGKPYLEFDIDRAAIARFGLTIREVQDVIEVAIGGKKITTTVEGRERYPVRVRYKRELRDNIEALLNVLVTASSGAQIPLRELSTLNYVRGPQAIKSEDTFLVSYVIFDKKAGVSEVGAVESAKDYLQAQIESGALTLPPGVTYTFSGSYENQVRSEKKLMAIIPLALFTIFLILYLQFKSFVTSTLIFISVFVAWSGGFLLLWFYNQDWFMNFDLLGTSLRDLFQINPINLSVAVWVGFLALFGIATDDGVVMSTYLTQAFQKNKPQTVADIRATTLQAGQRRIRACLMTTATTLLALLPILTSTGKGSEIMVPMAIPIFGGMLVALITLFIVPTLYCAVEEKRKSKAKQFI